MSSGNPLFLNPMKRTKEKVVESFSTSYFQHHVDFASPSSDGHPPIVVCQFLASGLSKHRSAS